MKNSSISFPIKSGSTKMKPSREPSKTQDLLSISNVNKALHGATSSSTVKRTKENHTSAAPSDADAKTISQSVQPQ